MAAIRVEDVAIRTSLRPGDLGWVLYRHGEVYERENGYGLSFVAYVAEGLAEFARIYEKDCARSRAWLCEYDGRIVGTLFALNRDEALQLRYFLLEPEARGIGLGRRLVGLFLEFAREAGFRAAYLWTTEEQKAAIRLYESSGFVLTEEKKSDELGKRLVELRYDLQL